MSVDYNIKVDGTPQTYGEGATRNSKEGKGRYDLIPTSPMASIMAAYADQNFISEIDDTKTNLIMCLYKYAMRRDFAKTIIILALASVNPGGNITSTCIPPALAYAIEHLAHHFEKGAKIYGEHNCEKGIPLESFIDSGMRHMTQCINKSGDPTENHWIAAIWNFWMAEWTICKDKHPEPSVSIDTPEAYKDLMESIFGAPVTVEENTNIDGNSIIDAVDKTPIDASAKSAVESLDEIFKKSGKFIWKPGVEDESDKTPKAATVDEIFKN